LLWERHLQRLRRDAGQLQIAPPTDTVLRAEVERLCRGATRAALKIQLTRGADGRGYRPSHHAPTRRILTLWRRAAPTQAAQDGVAVCLCGTRLSRNTALAGVKHLNRLERVLARGEWDDAYADGLMQDADGAVIEGTMSNLFLVRDGELLTPDLSDCGVAGVMREVVLERAQTLKIATRVAVVSLAMVQDAAELFLTNSLIGVWPVRRFDTKEYRIGPITRALQAAIAGDHDGA
jgi:4-amino-4-deoxychorismate lyase